jgi:hypothetical protein
MGKHKTKINTKQIICEQCGINIIKQNSKLKKHSFCSSSCSARYSNAHKTKGTRRAKLERWIEKQLTLLYPTLEIHYNKTDTITAELDIFVPSLKLAFELNGIFHYEPIYGKEKLTQIKTNDSRKFQACLEKHIELCIIDTSKQKYFKENTSCQFLKIITDIIDLKLFGTGGI